MQHGLLMKQLFILKGKFCLRKISLGSGDGFGVFEKRHQIPRSQNYRAGEHLLSRARRSLRQLLNSNGGC